MKTDAGRGRLYDALEQLKHRWDDVEPHWRDQVRLEFEEKIWGPLVQLAEDEMRAIDRLNQIFVQARRECQGDRGIGSIFS
jgi:hypothetical protein